MRKNIKLSLIFVLILIIACTIVVIWNPLTGEEDENISLSVVSSSTLMENSAVSVAAIDSSELTQGSVLAENSFSLESFSTAESSSTEISDLIPEDQPDDPNLNFEASGTSYDDIMVNVLTCLMTQDVHALSSYVGSQGLRLSPTGIATTDDVILSADSLASFFTMNAQSYGTYPGSGEDIYLTPSEYYNRYIFPVGFDFANSLVSYNDASDLTAVAGYINEPKTISYEYSPNVMEWKRLIVVYGSEGSGDTLCGIIYQDVTTN